MENLDSLTSVEDMNYEEAFSLLAQIVSALESGEKTLDEAISLYERGKKLADRCSALLDQAEMRVKILSGDELVDY